MPHPKPPLCKGRLFLFIYASSIFLTRTYLIKDTKVIIFLSNSQASLTNRVKCGIMFTLHKLHIFSLIRENTLVKSVFSLFSHRIGESLCSNIRGEAFFRCIPSGVHLFICGWGESISQDIFKKVIDITGIELMPGEPTVCLGNGEHGFECCCDECDYFLRCFPEFDPKKQKN